MRLILSTLILLILISSCNKGGVPTPIYKTDTLIIHDTTRMYDTTILDRDSVYIDSLRNGLWAYYSFNGDLNDQSGNGRNCIGYNGIQLSYDIWGNEKRALNFNGYNNYATIPKGTEFPEGDFTISFLMNSNNEAGRVFQKADINTATGASVGIGFDDDNADWDVNTKMVFNTSVNENVCSDHTDLSNSVPLFISKSFNSSSWYYVTCIYSNGIKKFYINGIKIAENDSHTSVLKQCSSATFNLGIWWLNDPRYFTGKIDELRIYTRELSEGEIQYLAKCAFKESSNL